MREEVEILPLPCPREEVPLADAVRGTVLILSMRGLKARGHYPRYLEQLSEEDRLFFPQVLAQVWVPMERAIRHYEACDRLDLDKHTIEDIGVESGRFINATWQSVMRRLAETVGATPWLAFENMAGPQGRSVRGGAPRAVKLGPKEAQVEWIGQPCARLRYFQYAYGGLLKGTLQLFRRVVYVHPVPALCTATTLGYRCSWV